MQSFVYMIDPAALPTVEMVYPLATPEGHQTVRTAVVAALMRLRPLSMIPAAETVDGVTAYYLSFCNVYVQILVVQLSERLSNVQITIVGRLVDSRIVQIIDETMLTSQIMKEVATIFNAVDRYGQDFLRKAYLLDELKPPPPPLENHQALFYYHRIYFPHLDDNQFSQLVEVPLQTLRNWRSKVGMIQGNFRPVPIDWSLVRPDMADESFEQFMKRQKERKRRR
jgi:hypothetical protein